MVPDCQVTMVNHVGQRQRSQACQALKMFHDRKPACMVLFRKRPQHWSPYGSLDDIGGSGRRSFAVQRVFHRNRPVGVARHSFPGVVVLVGTLSSQNERWNHARRASRNFCIQRRSRFCCLPGKCSSLRADRFLAIKLFDRNFPIGNSWLTRSPESGQRKRADNACPPLSLLPRPRPQEAMAFGRGC